MDDCFWSGCHYNGSRYLCDLYCWKDCSCVLESSVTMPFQLILLWAEICRPLGTLQSLFEGCFYLEDLYVKCGLLILFLLTAVHHWYSLCQGWSHGFLRTKKIVQHEFNPKLGAFWYSLIQASLSVKVKDGCFGSWLVCVFMSHFSLGLVAIKMKSCLNIKDILLCISKSFQNVNFLFKSNNFNPLVEIYLWAYFIQGKMGIYFNQCSGNTH